MAMCVAFSFRLGEEVAYTVSEAERKQCPACGGRGYFVGMDDLFHECSRCGGKGDVTTGRTIKSSYRGKVDGIRCESDVGSTEIQRFYRIVEDGGYRWVEEESVTSMDPSRF